MPELLVLVLVPPVGEPVAELDPEEALLVPEELELEEVELEEEVSLVEDVVLVDESESLLVEAITFNEEISEASPSHFFWITLMTPPFFRELKASETAC